MFFQAAVSINLILITIHVSAQQILGNHFGQAGTSATYDYVVVGGGTAGLGIAYRLAEDGNKTVALVEAGGFYEVESGNLSTVPSYCLQYAAYQPSSVNATPLVDWGFLTTPQEGVNNRTLHYGRGKMLGGSSAENAMIYNRGTIGSYQDWATAVNDSSWAFENLLPYFAKGVHYTPAYSNTTFRAANATHVPLPANPEAYNVSGGPVQISYPYSVPLSSWTQLSLRELGFPDQQDFLSGHLLGAQYAPVTVDAGSQIRSSSQEYLSAAIKSGRTNLKVYTHTLAKQVLFSNNKTASGVRVFSERGLNYVLSARKEVILSAGAFQSPQLLMVSGIGPKDQLANLNITVLADRPGVGQNMWDHLDFGPTYQLNVQGLTSQYSAGNQAAVEEYVSNRSGILTSPGVEFIGWEKLPAQYRTNFTDSTIADLAQFPADWPEVEYEVAQIAYALGTPTGIYGTIIAVPVSPLSRGNVTIVSNDTSDLPIINPNWLTSPTDQQVAIQAFKRARAMFNTKAIQPIIIGEEVNPGMSVQTDEQILEFVKSSAYQNWHASCTCESLFRNPLPTILM